MRLLPAQKLIQCIPFRFGIVQVKHHGIRIQPVLHPDTVTHACACTIMFMCIFILFLFLKAFRIHDFSAFIRLERVKIEHILLREK